MSIANLSQVGHIGMVVKDLEKTTKFLSEMWGLGPWNVFEYEPEQSDLLMGKPFKQSIAHAELGSSIMEVVQHMEGPGNWADFVKNKGEGIHHISFVVTNWQETVDALKKQGSTMIAGGIFQGKHWCYFDTTPGGLVVELAEA